MTNVIEEIRQITADEVAKKNDAAKINFPNIIEKIKAAAAKGNSVCILSQTEMNEYDKKLLIMEGFSVSLVDRPINNRYDAMAQYNPHNTKQWEIKW